MTILQESPAFWFIKLVIFLGGGKVEKGWVRSNYGRKSKENWGTAKENGWRKAENDWRSNEDWAREAEIKKERR